MCTEAAAADGVIESELHPLQAARAPFELWAKIKLSSKYCRQGVDASGKRVAFPIDSIHHSYYCFRGIGNIYRLEDLEIFARVGKGLVRISK